MSEQEDRGKPLVLDIDVVGAMTKQFYDMEQRAERAEAAFTELKEVASRLVASGCPLDANDGGTDPYDLLVAKSEFYELAYMLGFGPRKRQPPEQARAALPGGDAEG